MWLIMHVLNSMVVLLISGALLILGELGQYLSCWLFLSPRYQQLLYSLVGRIGRFKATSVALQWRHIWRDGFSDHQPYHCLLNHLFSRRSKKTSKCRVTGLCAWNSPVTGEFPAQMASNARNVSIWWRHHGKKWVRVYLAKLKQYLRRENKANRK